MHNIYLTPMKDGSKIKAMNEIKNSTHTDVNVKIWTDLNYRQQKMHFPHFWAPKAFKIRCVLYEEI